MKSLFKTVIIFGMVVICKSSWSSEDSSDITTKSTLTTAKALPITLAKTTRMHRRNNADRIEEFSSTPLDLFRARDPERRSMNTIWKWDFWCQLQPRVGNCSKSLRRIPDVPKQSYYYDAQLDTCLKFSFSGCDGNKNNFQSLVECERHCKGSTFMTLKESTRTTFCGLQPNAGICMAIIERYYYDINSHECKMFYYGGCGGNQNRFKSMELCEDGCKEEGK